MFHKYHFTLKVKHVLKFLCETFGVLYLEMDCRLALLNIISFVNVLYGELYCMLILISYKILLQI